MSKMGQVNFNLQEQAEELGFESVQEALDNGYRAYLGIGGTARLVKMKPGKELIEQTMNSIKELAEAHEDYEKRRRLMIMKLEMIIADTPYKVYKDALTEVIEFIKEKEF